MADDVLSDSEIGRWITRVREAAGLTQRQVAERVGLRPEKLCRYERGSVPVPANWFIAIAAVCGKQVTFRGRLHDVQRLH